MGLDKLTKEQVAQRSIVDDQVMGMLIAKNKLEVVESHDSSRLERVGHTEIYIGNMKSGAIYLICTDENSFIKKNKTFQKYNFFGFYIFKSNSFILT